MSFHVFINSTTADANHVMNNFYYLLDGDRLPYSQTAAGSLAAADSAGDLGASATVWNYLHTDSLNVEGSIASVDKSLWYLVASTTLSDTATSITFSLSSGFDGDSVEMYHILFKGYHDATGYSLWYFNGDSGANYGHQRIESPIAAHRNTAQNNMYSNYALAYSTTSKNTFSDSKLYAKTGDERLMLSDSADSASEDYLGTMRIFANIWNNTVDTLTTIKITGNFATNTLIQIWSRQ